MSDSHGTWTLLPNPFFYSETKATTGILGQVSGRHRDIINIVYNDQSAIILSGAPRIGKTALVRYLQAAERAESWSWRQEVELTKLLEPEILKTTHFVQIDLSPLEDIYQIVVPSELKKKLYDCFLEQCGRALYELYKIEKRDIPADLRNIRVLLRHMRSHQPKMRCFVLLDNIDRFGIDTPAFLLENTSAHTPQERGIALLNNCGAIGALVGLLDEFRNFGVILALESLPRASVDAQFLHVSADLARFATTTLQAFTYEDALAFLKQRPEQFVNEWAQDFKERGGDSIFDAIEQEWLYRQAGTHPYILQQFCFHAFYFKLLRADRSNKKWMGLEEEDKTYLIERVRGTIITFLNYMWRRLQTALDTVSIETREVFIKFILSFEESSAFTCIEPEEWNKLGPEVQYILYNEGIVRFDPLQEVHYPGALLRDYLLQRAKELEGVRDQPSRLIIKFPQGESEPMVLSELEYRLVKTLLQQRRQYTESELMKAGWNRLIEGKTFTQRMYQLRKKLKGHTQIDVIVNHYGGLYSLPHPEWFQFLD